MEDIKNVFLSIDTTTYTEHEFRQISVSNQILNNKAIDDLRLVNNQSDRLDNMDQEILYSKIEGENKTRLSLDQSLAIVNFAENPDNALLQETKVQLEAMDQSTLTQNVFELIQKTDVEFTNEVISELGLSFTLPSPEKGLSIKLTKDSTSNNSRVSYFHC